MPAVIAAILLLQSGGVDSSEPPTVTAVRVDRAPVVDGRLDDPEWSLAPAVTDSRQTDPDEGAPVSEPTAVRVLYDGSCRCTRNRSRSPVTAATMAPPLETPCSSPE